MSERASMALPKDYTSDSCSLARALEVVGERWTLLIVRDAFFGVRRFGDFAAHLSLPRAVLTQRLAALAEVGVLSVELGAHGHGEYVLTAKGLDLWPAVRALLAWGDDHCSDAGPRRVFRHADDDGTVARDGTCAVCRASVPVADLVTARAPAGHHVPARPIPCPWCWPGRTGFWRPPNTTLAGSDS